MLMVLKTTCMSSQSQYSNQFWKIWIRSQDFGPNVSKFDSPNQTFQYWDILTSNSESDANFQNQLLCLNCELKLVVLSTMNQKTEKKTFVLPLKRSSATVNEFIKKS